MNLFGFISVFLLSSSVYTQTTITFTNAGATINTGPTQSQVNSEYSGTALNGKVTINTTGIQEWTVPATGNYTIEAWGAEGGDDRGNYNYNGDTDHQPGKGARIKGTFTLQKDAVIKIVQIFGNT